MTAALLAPMLLSLLVSAAHALRGGDFGLCAALLVLSGLGLTRRAFVRPVLVMALAALAVMWAVTTRDLAAFRMAFGQPYLRLVVILSGVILAHVAAAALLARPLAAARFARGREAAAPMAGAFALTVALLGLARAKTPFPVLLADRFLPGSGWLEILLLALYAAFIMGRMADPARMARTRAAYWAVFSAVFFLQLALGLAGVPGFLMTGALHLPVPALILAGPLYRGEGFFMPILYAATVLFVGPGWCSHLCYIGAWDDRASRLSPKRPGPLPDHAPAVRAGILVLTAAVALGLRFFEVGTGPAVFLAAAFGLCGVAVMLTLSRRRGMMVHCAAYCPIGLIGNLLGRLHPFRMRMAAGCDRCGRCARVCRYGALSAVDLAKGRPGLTCTLCGDCVGVCKGGFMGYRLPGLSPEAARLTFLVLCVSLHAAFLGVARI